MWKADKFNADSLAAFYKEIGAKFIGVMAVHHDNFDLYDSSHQPWNSVNMGPKLDIVRMAESMQKSRSPFCHFLSP